jgi:hypothetical protein
MSFRFGRRVQVSNGVLKIGQFRSKTRELAASEIVRMVRMMNGELIRGPGHEE